MKNNQLNGKELEKIKHILESGGIIVYPTETAYGIGCIAYNEDAIKRIFQIKKRDYSQPMAILVNSIETIEKIAYLNARASLLIRKFMPGPLVISLKKKEIIPDILNKTNIAFRISSYPIAKQLMDKIGKPLVSTSANLSGTAPLYSIKSILKQFKEEQFDLIIDDGVLPKRKPSTLIDFSLEPSPQIIREGEITADEILSTLEIPLKYKKQYIKY